MVPLLVAHARAVSMISRPSGMAREAVSILPLGAAASDLVRAFGFRPLGGRLVGARVVLWRFSIPRGGLGRVLLTALEFFLFFLLLGEFPRTLFELVVRFGHRTSSIEPR